MKKKTIFMIVPAIVAIGAITGCKGGSDPQPTVKTLTILKVQPTTSKYSVDYEFDKSDLNVTATWSDGSITTPKGADYTVSEQLPYKFKATDIATGKDFTVTYLQKKRNCSCWCRI